MATVTTNFRSLDALESLGIDSTVSPESGLVAAHIAFAYSKDTEWESMDLESSTAVAGSLINGDYLYYEGVNLQQLPQRIEYIQYTFTAPEPDVEVFLGGRIVLDENYFVTGYIAAIRVDANVPGIAPVIILGYRDIGTFSNIFDVMSITEISWTEGRASATYGGNISGRTESNLAGSFSGRVAGTVTALSYEKGVFSFIATGIEMDINFAASSRTERLAHVLRGNDEVSGTVGNEFLFGFDGSDALFGLEGRDTLDGGAGADTLAGGEGNDTYVVTAGDVVTELANAGADAVQCAIDWTLGANIERLIFSGSAAVKGSGNVLNNTLDGNDASNTLRGEGGADTLTGFGGDDLLYGGNGVDVLSGGLGNDKLTGNAGKDVFIFDTEFSVTANKDIITDFVHGTDSIRLDEDVFTSLAQGGLSDEQFHSGPGVTAALDADDRVLYNTTTGGLFYDADGTGEIAALRFAVLGTATHPAISAADFVVVG